MTFVTLFRRVPEARTGMIGVAYDHKFEAFEANLGWLGTTGVLVDQRALPRLSTKSPSAMWFNRSCPTKENRRYR